jgi:hypothetical protein
MKLTKQEEQIKRKMAHLEGAVDQDALWEALESHVPPKKRKRRGLILWFLLPLIVGMIALSYYYFINTSTKSIEPTPENKEGKPTLYAKNPKQQHISQNIQENKIKHTHSEEYIQSNAPAYQELEKTHSSTQTKGDDDSNADVNLISINDSTKTTSTFIQENIKGAPTLVKWTLSPLRRKTFKLCKAKMHHSSMDVIDFEPAENKRLFLFSWSIQGVLGSAKMTFESENEEDEEMVAYINAISSVKPVLGADILGQYAITPYLSVQSGLSLKRLTVAHAPDWQKMETESFTNLSGLTQNISKEHTYRAIGHLYHFSVDLPLGINYHFFRGGSWSAELYAGSDLNLLVSTQGYFVGNDLKLKESEGLKINWFEQLQSPKWTLGLQVTRKMTPGFEFSLGTKLQRKNVRYDLNQRAILEKYQLFQVTMGLNYRLK